MPEAEQRDKVPDRKRCHVAASTIDAAAWLAHYADAARFRTWLDQRDPTEVVEIMQLLKKRKSAPCPTPTK